MSKRNVPTTRRRTGAARLKAPALEPELREILGPPPLLKGDSEDDYNDLYDRVRSAVLPKDVIEELWVRDVVDLTWEILRLRRLKANLMKAASSQGLALVLTDIMLNYRVRQQLVADWASGDVDAKQKVDILLEAAGVDNGTIEAQTFSARLDDFERIDRLTMQSEGRRNAVLREVDRHRDAVARRLRDAVVEYEDVEFEDVTKPDGKAPA